MNERIKELAKQIIGWKAQSQLLEFTLVELAQFAELVAANAVEKEREACAKLCDHWASYGAPAAEACAESIRERGDKNESRSNN